MMETKKQRYSKSHLPVIVPVPYFCLDEGCPEDLLLMGMTGLRMAGIMSKATLLI